MTMLRFAMRALVVLAVAGGPVWAQQYLISTVAGGGTPLTPASALSVPLPLPYAVAEDAAGNAYFCAGNWVFKSDTNGIVTRVAGGGTMSGEGVAAIDAQLNQPRGVAVDPMGQLYISDTGNHRVRKVTMDGLIATVAGTGVAGYTSSTGPATSSQLSAPMGLGLDSTGNLYIADSSNAVIVRVTPAGTYSIVAGNGASGSTGDGGQAVAAELAGPSDVKVDATGNLYIADSSNNRIRKVTTDGKIATMAGNGTAGFSGDGFPAVSAELKFPEGVAVDAAGNLYIADAANWRVREVTRDGTITTVAGNTNLRYSVGGPATSHGIGFPAAVAVGLNGDLIIADSIDNVILRVSASGYLSALAGTGSQVSSISGGPATAAIFPAPHGVAVDSAFNYYIADSYNNQVYKVGVNGVISIFAGTGVGGPLGNGGPATSASLGYPSSLATDSAGNLYIADTANSMIRKVTTDGKIATVAGGGTGADGGPATSASLLNPTGVAVDRNGNIYIADRDHYTIRKVTFATGTISTVAGTGTSGSSSDGGPATSAQLKSPMGVALDALGDIFIADGGDNKIRKVTTDGRIGTLVSGLHMPEALVLDVFGNVYVADTDFNTIDILAPNGTVTSVVGNGNQGYTGDGGPATSAEFSIPDGIAVNAYGDVYVADSGNRVVRLLTPVATQPVLTVAVTVPVATVGQQAWYTVTVSNAPGAGPTNGTVTVAATFPAGLTLVSMSGNGWNCSGSACTRSDVLQGGSSYQTITVAMNVVSGGPSQVESTVTVTGGGSSPSSASDWVRIMGTLPAPLPTYPAPNGVSGISLTPTFTWAASAGATGYEVLFGVQGAMPTLAFTAAPSFSPGTLNPGTTYNWQVMAWSASGWGASSPWSFKTSGTPVGGGLRFVPVTPCRVVDTRNAAGAFGGPTMTAGSSRSFPVPQSACNIPATAQAYSLNVTVVPEGPLGYLTLWPTAKAQPNASTLNSPSGAVLANAAIVPAGTGGAVSVYVTDSTDVILDINGYFDTSTGTTSYAFYPATPCRVTDTRGATGEFGGPTMQSGLSRDFPIPLSSCDIPPTARAYSLNATVVPEGPLGYLSTWPTGQAQPNVSTLNSPTGKVLANAAIVPGGSNESISVFVTNTADVILDVNGYFAAPGSPQALTFYPVTPCRVADTRNPAGAFGGPIMGAGTSRSFAIPASACSIPATAAAYSLNVTVVPGGPLGYLSAWPVGVSQPVVSTLNSPDGSVLANAAIVPAGTGGAVDVFVTDATHVILDINGYFAP